MGRDEERSRPGPRNGLKTIATAGSLAAGLILPVLAATAPATTAAAATAGGLGPPNTFVATAPLGVAQSGQTATLLPDGNVLTAAGGTTSAELYTRPPGPGRRPVTAASAERAPRSP